MSLTETLLQLAPSPQMLLLIVGAIALLESLALVGLLLPGVVLITAAASLAGHQDMAVSSLLLAAFIGAVLGDGISFSLGYTQRERVTRLWPLSRHPEWLARGARFFQRYGSLSVFFGRFVGPVRPVIPLIAGMLHMSPEPSCGPTWPQRHSGLRPMFCRVICWARPGSSCSRFLPGSRHCWSRWPSWWWDWQWCSRGCAIR
ncbi:DedA family protein [Billgrantia tianxiuensis]|uniref:DedA family protein n=1 Tax=Billgrantia tianxiuensis TaxID=2497861 RepID=UPI0030EDE2FF